VVAAADVIALGVLSRLHSLGFRVPEDFRVIGFDGIGVSHLAHPTLTTVRQPVEEISQVIRDLVTRGLADGLHGEREMIEIEPELVIGGSSPVAG
jgi:LacI family transcriptional regulator